jgi:phosphoribosylformimino-5-aminoimidazole carboxamide ribotide isomerase
MVTGGSIAVKDRDEFLGWLADFGPEKIILGADVRERKIAVSGWMEETSLEILPFLEDYAEKGVRKVICTDIEHDGMLEGPSGKLYREIKRKIPSLHLIASGGIGKMDDILEMDAMGVDGVIVGKAIYEHRISLKELEIYMRNQVE